MRTDRFTDAEVIARAAGDVMADVKPLCSVCLRETRDEDLRHHGGEQVCPTCQQTARGREALETYDQRRNRLFGAGTKKGRR